MVKVVVSPQDGTNKQRVFALPACAFAIMDKLEQANELIDAAQHSGKGKLRLTLNIAGNTARMEVVSLVE